jgi:hypothetical protein
MIVYSKIVKNFGVGICPLSKIVKNFGVGSCPLQIYWSGQLPSATPKKL